MYFRASPKGALAETRARYSVNRIDLCDECHRYIKTIDTRGITATDRLPEDLATLHLDVVATQTGYSRLVPNLWSK